MMPIDGAFHSHAVPTQIRKFRFRKLIALRLKPTGNGTLTESVRSARVQLAVCHTAVDEERGFLQSLFFAIGPDREKRSWINSIYRLLLQNTKTKNRSSRAELRLSSWSIFSAANLVLNNNSAVTARLLAQTIMITFIREPSPEARTEMLAGFTKSIHRISLSGTSLSQS